MKKKKSKAKISPHFLLHYWLMLKSRIEKEKGGTVELLHKFAVRVEMKDKGYTIQCNTMDAEFFVFDNNGADKQLIQMFDNGAESDTNTFVSIEKLEEWLFPLFTHSPP